MVFKDVCFLVFLDESSLSMGRVKYGDVRLRRLTNSSRWCARCDLAEEENANYVQIQCSAYQKTRNDILSQISEVENALEIDYVGPVADIMLDLRGKPVRGYSYEEMVPLWLVVCVYIDRL